MCVCISVTNVENGPTLNLCVDGSRWGLLLHHSLMRSCVCVCSWGGSSFQCLNASVCTQLYYFIGVTEQLSFLNECNYVINNWVSRYFVSLLSSDWDCQETKHHLCTSHSLPLTGGKYVCDFEPQTAFWLPFMHSSCFSSFALHHSVCLCVLQHQQQVVQAVERAKQVTMAELNAVIGVRGLPGLPPTVCILLISLYSHKLSQCLFLYRYICLSGDCVV